MLEHRRHTRIRQFIDASWAVEGVPVTGQGLVSNISLSGALFTMDKTFIPKDRTRVAIHLEGDDRPFEAKRGKVVWFRKINDGQQFQCGLEFDRDSAFDKQFRDWIDAKVEGLAQASDINILRNYV